MAALLWAGTGGPEGAVEPVHPGRRREHEEQRAHIHCAAEPKLAICMHGAVMHNIAYVPGLDCRIP